MQLFTRLTLPDSAPLVNDQCLRDHSNRVCNQQEQKFCLVTPVFKMCLPISLTPEPKSGPQPSSQTRATNLFPRVMTRSVTQCLLLIERADICWYKPAGDHNILRISGKKKNPLRNEGDSLTIYPSLALQNVKFQIKIMCITYTHACTHANCFARTRGIIRTATPLLLTLSAFPLLIPLLSRIRLQ